MNQAKQIELDESEISVLIRDLIEKLQNESREIRYEAALILGNEETLPSEAVSALIFAMETDKDDDVRSKAVRALGKQETILPLEAIAAMIDAMKTDKNDDVRYEAARALGNQENYMPSEAISALIYARWRRIKTMMSDLKLLEL
jgi:HEAT repeat protein